ncbi:MAG TPA: hypothetical protein VHL58_04490 [Thermoanaerobaculia bacterium]|nr:hypothetical protein [Thermoanaerobaculia bacterium]
MISSSVALVAGGVAASFAPEELLRSVGSAGTGLTPIFVQLLGALYFGSAITNYTAKGNLIGGIYSRPLSLGNFLHFMMGALALARYQSAHSANTVIVALLVIYSIFALLFGWVVFGHGAACRVAE